MFGLLRAPPTCCRSPDAPRRQRACARCRRESLGRLGCERRAGGGVLCLSACTWMASSHRRDAPRAGDEGRHRREFGAGPTGPSTHPCRPSDVPLCTSPPKPSFATRTIDRNQTTPCAPCPQHTCGNYLGDPPTGPPRLERRPRQTARPPLHFDGGRRCRATRARPLRLGERG